MEEKQSLQTEDAISSLPPKITKENIDPHAGTKHQQVMRWVKSILYTILSSLLIAFAAYALITPNEFTIGGISGIAILVNVATGGKVAQSVVLFGLNLPLVILAFFFVKKRFAILTSLNMLLSATYMRTESKLPKK